MIWECVNVMDDPLRLRLHALLITQIGARGRASDPTLPSITEGFLFLNRLQSCLTKLYSFELCQSLNPPLKEIAKTPSDVAATWWLSVLLRQILDL